MCMAYRFCLPQFVPSLKNLPWRLAALQQILHQGHKHPQGEKGTLKNASSDLIIHKIKIETAPQKKQPQQGNATPPLCPVQKVLDENKACL